MRVQSSSPVHLIGHHVGGVWLTGRDAVVWAMSLSGCGWATNVMCYFHQGIARSEVREGERS